MTSGFGLASVIIAIVLPAIVGPLFSLFVHVAVSCIFLTCRVNYGDDQKIEVILINVIKNFSHP